jgi:hypothetical protein
LWVILAAADRGGIPAHVRSTSNNDHKFNVLASVAMGQCLPSSVALLAMAREQLTPKVSINKLRLDERRILRPHGGLLSPHL